MIPIAEARQFVLDHSSRLEPRELDLEGGSGLVLARPVFAKENVPSFANSAVDGYALRAADVLEPGIRLAVVFTIRAGQTHGTAIRQGEAARIMTGAAIPLGADAVCMLEHATAGDNATVVIERPVARGANVRRPGEDIELGTEVFASGTVLGPSHLGVLASLGIENVIAHPRPRVGVLSCGDELVFGNEPIAPGKIRDSNRPALLAQLARDGWETADLGRMGDDVTEIAAALQRSGEVCDAIVTSGGVSVGDHDLMKVAFEKLSAGTMRWMQVAVRPAKPFAFGVLEANGTAMFGLPGNPVAALVSYELFVRPALRTMAGHRNLYRPRLSAVAKEGLRRKPDGKVHLARALVSTGADGILVVQLTGGQQSHMLRAMAMSNALAIVPDGYGFDAGDRVNVMLLAEIADMENSPSTLDSHKIVR
jgi:molybdopterin molybdotransferase